MVETDRNSKTYSPEEEQFIIDNYGDIPPKVIADRLGRTRAAVVRRASKLREDGHDVERLREPTDGSNGNHSSTPGETETEETNEVEEETADDQRDSGAAILCEADEGTIRKLEELRKHQLALLKLMIGFFDEGVKKIALYFMLISGVQAVALIALTIVLIMRVY